MPIQLATSHVDITSRKRRLTVAGTLSGAYVQGTPVVLDWTTVNNPKFLGAGKPASNPSNVKCTKAPVGYDVVLVPGTTMKTWGFKIYVSGGNELASGAFPAGLTADTFEFEIEGRKGAF